MATLCAGVALSLLALLPLEQGIAAPVEVDTPRTANEVAYNGVHLFVARQGFGTETCQIDNSETMPVLVRMNPDGTGQLTLIERCSAFIRDLAADTNHVYYVDSDSDLKRQPVFGGPVEIVAFDVDGPIALDNTHVYWLEDNGPSEDLRVRRRPKTGGGAEEVAAFPNVDVSLNFGGIAVDDTHVYWTLGMASVDVIDQPGQGVIGRAPKTGGAVQTLADTSDGVDDAFGIAVDASHVYWTELGSGRLRRVPKSGGTVQSYNAIDEYIQAGPLVLDDQYAFFSDTVAAVNGRLRRVRKDGDPTFVDLTLGVPRVNDIALVGSSVYWAQSGGVFRSGVNDPGVQVDLSLDRIEVTQGLQNLDPARLPIRQVADKPTIVRAYPSVDLVMTQDVNAELRGYRNGMELPGSPLAPITDSLLVRTAPANRADTGQTFNFHVPAQWRSGDVTLRVVIDPANTVPESDEGNNTIERNFTFLPKAPLCLVISRVDTPGPEIPPLYSDDLYEQIELATLLFPTHEIWPYEQGTLSDIGGGPYELPADDSRLLNRMAWRAAMTDDPDECQAQGATVHYAGALDEFTETGGAFGKAFVDGIFDALWFKEAGLAAILDASEAAPFDQDFLLFTVPFGGSVLVHEVAHNRGRRHIDCGGPSSPDGSYPYDPCQLDDDTSSQGHWMLDPRLMGTQYEDEATFSGEFIADFLTYADPAWVSDYTYNALFDIQAASMAAAAPAGTPFGETGEILLVSAFGNPVDGTGEIGTVQRLPGAFFAAGKRDRLAAARDQIASGGDWEIVLRDAHGVVLASYAFDFVHTNFQDEENGSGSDNVLLPVAAEPGLAEIALRRLGSDVAVRSVSANPPAVQLLSPNGGEILSEPFAVTWAASDPDGDDLLHTLQYSPDLGASWQTIAVDVAAAPFTVERGAGLAGSPQGLLRIVTTDGANSVVDQSDAPFALSDHVPRVYILRPDLDDVFGASSPVVLRGAAMDNEDGPLDDARLQWSVDGTPAGTGREIIIDGLEVGIHTAVLLATDSAGNTVSDNVRFLVESRSCNGNGRKADVVVVLDTSSAMNPYVANLCTAVPQWMARLSGLGVDTRHAITTIDRQRACGTFAIADIDPTTTVDHPSDWAQAVQAIAMAFDWREDSTRMILLLTNQGAENGSPVDAGDMASLDLAVAAANANGVAVSTLLQPVPRPDEADVAMLVESIAEATGGTSAAGGSAPPVDMGDRLQKDQGRLGCAPEVGHVGPAGPVDDSTNITLRGRHLWPGAVVSVGGLRATSVKVSADGTVLTFDLPRGLQTDLNAEIAYTVEVSRPGAASSSVPAAIALVAPLAPPPSGPEPVVVPMPVNALYLLAAILMLIGVAGIRFLRHQRGPVRH